MSLQQKMHALFLLDQQLRGLRSRLDAATNRLRAQQGKLQRLTQQRQEMADQHKQAQAKAGALELQARDIDARIARLREQMNTIKNNKEYSALLIEVNTFKNDKTKVDDETLEQMGKVEALADEVKAAEGKVEEQKKLVAGAENEVATCQKEIGEQLTAVTAQRAAAAQELPAQARATFDRLADMHEGEALAGVIEESRKHLEYTCGGCYMSIPVDRVNSLMRGQDEIVCCPNCQRMLYLEPALKESMQSK